MDRDILNNIIKTCETGKTAAYRHVGTAIDLARYLGLRAEESVSQKLEDCHLNDRGKYGYGYITVSNPKHGRPRTIDITSREAKNAITDRISYAKSNGWSKILPISKKTLQNELGYIKRQIGIKADLQGMHSIRKVYAQNTYDFFRQKHTRREAIGLTNLMLGHGYSRAEKDLKTYVENIW